MSRRKSRNARAFTLIELLVVITIIGILVALLLVGIQKVRAAAERTECASKLRQLGLALHAYHDIHGVFPVQGALGAPYPGSWQSWMFKILPHIEQDALYRQGWVPDDQIDGLIPSRPSDFSDPDSAYNRWWKTFGTPVPAFLCPSDPRPLAELANVHPAGLPAFPGGVPFALNSYVGVSGRSSLEAPAWDGDGPIDGSHLTGIIVGPNVSVRMSQVTRGLSNTLMVGERPPGPINAQSACLGDWANRFWDTSLWAVGNYNLSGLPHPGLPDETCPDAAYFSPGDIKSYCHTAHFWSFHSGGGNWLLADGSVQFMTYDVGDTLIVEMSSIK